MFSKMFFDILSIKKEDYQDIWQGQSIYLVMKKIITVN